MPNPYLKLWTFIQDQLKNCVYLIHEEGCCVSPVECSQKPSKKEEENGGEGCLTVCSGTGADIVPVGKNTVHAAETRLKWSLV